MAELSTQQETGQNLTVSAFEELLDRTYTPETETRKEVDKAVVVLANQLSQQALKDVQIIPDDAIKTIQSVIAALDKKLTDQVNLILHHPDFQALEGAWRGLHYLVNNTETDTQLKIKVFNISKKELARNLERFRGAAWDQSPLFKKIYEDGYGVLGGEPYGCLVGDYHFDHSPTDVGLLSDMAKIAAAAHAPFIAGASPAVMRMDSWLELSNPSSLSKIFDTPEHAAWKSLRKSDDARYIGLAMPRFLARLPYGAKTKPVDEFAFEEDTASADSSKYTWANSAYAMATNITAAFKTYGWCTQIRGVESGGNVPGLPVHTFPTDDGGVDMKCPTEIAITDRRENELAGLGFMPLLHRKNSDEAVFIGAQSLQLPATYDTEEATANANLSARLPYMFATCRFAHYLKVMVRDKIGAFMEKEDMQKWLQEWINNYKLLVPATASPALKASKPLAEARVEVTAIEGNPGFYNAVFYLRPHYQLEGLTASLRLVSQMPNKK